MRQSPTDLQSSPATIRINPLTSMQPNFNRARSASRFNLPKLEAYPQRSVKTRFASRSSRVLSASHSSLSLWRACIADSDSRQTSRFACTSCFSSGSAQCFRGCNSLCPVLQVSCSQSVWQSTKRHHFRESQGRIQTLDKAHCDLHKSRFQTLDGRNHRRSGHNAYRRNSALDSRLGFHRRLRRDALYRYYSLAVLLACSHQTRAQSVYAAQQHKREVLRFETRKRGREQRFRACANCKGGGVI